ncbi:hypothetical protein BH09PSE3_BH09PSE3_04100 [soil metagenome]
MDDGDILIVNGEERSGHALKSGACQLMQMRDEGFEASIDDTRSLNRLGTILSRYDRAIISCSADKRDTWAMLLKGANIRGEIMLPGLSEIGAVGLGRFAGCATLIVSRGPLSIAARLHKRLLDICFVVPLLIVMLPVIVAAALIVRLESRGPTLVRQGRVGRNGRPFEVAVFRCTRVDEDGRNVLTVFGRMMRRVGIDRLPMFFNVLVGEMSMVGAQLHSPESTFGMPALRLVERDYWQRHALKPGIISHTSDWKSEEVPRLSARLNADHHYVSQWSITGDILMICNGAGRTVRRRINRVEATSGGRTEGQEAEAAVR